jgi:hypothetical protein
LVELSIETGIPMSEWQSADDVMTALEVLKEKK